jgi:hypothetical protein
MVIFYSNVQEEQAAINTPYVKSSSSSTKNYENGKEITLLREYVEKLDGTPNCYDNVQSLLPRLFHPDFYLVTSDENELNYDEFVSLVMTFCQNGCICNIESLKRNEDGTVTVVINNILPGEGGDRTEQRLYFKDSMVVRVELSCVHADQFDSLIGRVKDLPQAHEDEILTKFRAFIGQFDGSPAVLSKAEEVMVDLFDPDVRIHTGDKDDPAKDYHWFVGFVTTFARDGSVARIEELERTDTGLRTVIQNTVKGRDMGSTEQRGILKNGRIVYWEAVPGDEKQFKAMVDHVMFEFDSV